MKLSIYEMLDVEEDEVFELNGYKYKIMQGKMYGAVNGNVSTWEKVTYPLHLFHEADFERLPFVPKVGEEYWTPTFSKEDLVISMWTRNNHDDIDFKNLELGLCYRTKSQAEQEGIQKMKALAEKWGFECE